MLHHPASYILLFIADRIQAINNRHNQVLTSLIMLQQLAHAAIHALMFDDIIPCMALFKKIYPIESVTKKTVYIQAPTNPQHFLCCVNLQDTAIVVM